jgi:subtilisin family serine protease
VGKGVAPAAKLYAIKVWDVGNSSADVLVAGYEFAVDPNQDGSTSDHVDVLSFSGGVDYGTSNSAEALAAERVVDVGTVFVASAGNAGNQSSGGSAYILGTPAAAPVVVAVAASIDQFVLNTITVNSPAVTLPDGGFIAVQDWGAPIPAGGFTTDLFDARETEPPADPGGVVEPGDQQFCAPLPAGSLAGLVPVVFKGDTADGDCSGSTKVFNAQEAGAIAVVLHSGFTGLPFVLGSNGEAVTIPAVMVSTDDGQALLNALSPAPPAYNTADVNVTLNDFSSPVPGFEDAMTDFTSEGPARGISALKPDISAPGFDIVSAAVGTGTGGASLSGTSMAAPHVSGVAALLLQLHSSWTPVKIKSLLMNQAKRGMANNDLSTPVSATVMGSGRVQAYQSALADTIAYPPSLSFGLVFAEGPRVLTRALWVDNRDHRPHHYTVTADVRYADFDPSVAAVTVSKDGTTFGASRSFTVGARDRQRVWLRLRVKPGVISEAEQEFGWYYFHPNVDGSVAIQQTGGGGSDVLRVPWHVAPLAASESSFSESELDLTGGPALMTLEGAPAPGVDFGDLYHLGTTDPARSMGEEDIVAVGVRGFTGPVINGFAPGLPTGTDALAGIDWLTFLTQADTPTEPIEFVVQSAGVRNTTETLEVDVAVDLGADGVFADTDLQADMLIVKTPDAGGNVCVFDLSLPDPFADCAALYFADYSNYNANVIGLAVDATAMGLTNGTPSFSYQVTACTGRFAGDDPAQICDTAGAMDDATGTYDLVFDPTAPPLSTTPSVCGGFFGGTDCAGGVTVAVDAAGPGDDPTLLAVFPNNAPSSTPTLITTLT